MKNLLITILFSFIVSTSYSAGTASGDATNFGKEYKSAIKLINKKKYDNASRFLFLFLIGQLFFELHF